MKRVVAMLAVVVIVVGMVSVGYAKPCPLPQVNTDKEIKFRGLDWYTDYEETLKNLKVQDLLPGRKDFPDMGPHWESAYGSIYCSEYDTGGRILLHDSKYELPNVAGHRLLSMKIYFMYNPQKGFSESYKEKNAIQFYYAEYDFTTDDNKFAYQDIAKKLKEIYGENPYVGDFYGDEYLVWVNKELAAVILSYDSISITLAYMAPGAEDNLLIVEEKEAQRKRDNAVGDTTGL